MPTWDGIRNRITGITGNVSDVMEAQFGLAKDIATSAFTSDDFDGFRKEVAASARTRLTQYGTGVSGAAEKAVGAVPEVVRAPIRKAGQELEEYGRDFIREPLATVAIAEQLAEKRGGGPDNAGFGNPQQWRELTKRKTWADAKGLANHYSLGQAFYLDMTDGADFDNPETVQRYAGSTQYKVATATLDAVGRIFLDPTVIAGKGISVARGVDYVGKSATVGRLDPTNYQRKIISGKDKHKQINKAIGSAANEKFKADIRTKNAVEVQQQYFADHDRGGLIATLYKDAERFGDDADEVTDLLTRSFLGDEKAYLELGERSTTLQNKLNRFYGEQADIWQVEKDLGIRKRPKTAPAPTNYTDTTTDITAQQQRFDIFNTDENLQRLQKEIDESHPMVEFFEKVDLTAASLAQAPRYTTLSAARTAAARSSVYQDGLLGARFRKVDLTRLPSTLTNKLPHKMLVLDEYGSFNQIKRQLHYSTLDKAEQDELLTKYMAAANTTGRQQTALEVEQRITEDMLTKANVSDEDFGILMGVAKSGRSVAQNTIANRKYDAENLTYTYYDDDARETVSMTMAVSQNASVLPMVDVQRLRKAVDIISRQMEAKAANPKAKGPKLDLRGSAPREALEMYYKIWKPATLLRAGWPIRVGTDEQLSIIATAGAMTQLMQLFGGKNSVVGELFGATKSAKELQAAKAKNKELIKFVDAFKETYKPGQGSLVVGGIPFEDVFGAADDKANMIKDLVSAKGTYDELTGQAQTKILQKLENPIEVDDVLLPNGNLLFGSWKSVNPADKADRGSYVMAWEHVMNRQFANDPLYRMALKGVPEERALRWLRKEPEGRAYMKELSGIRGTSPGHQEEWLTHLYDQVERYVPRGAAPEVVREVTDKILDSKATFKDLQKLVPDGWNRMPVIHGQEIVQASGKGVIADHVDNFVQTAFKYIGQLPTDTFARNPFAKAMYRKELDRLVGMYEKDAITAETVKHFESLARSYAVTQSRKYLFDLKERSEFSEMVRFISPFFMAYQEVLSRWVGIAIEQPQKAAVLRLLWDSPERAGIIYDENGRQVDGTGQATDPLTGEKHAAGKERIFRFFLPEGAGDWPVIGDALETQGEITFNKKYVNIIGSSPGVGPPVQLLVNEIAKRNPTLEDDLKFFLPFGVQEDPIEILEPTTIKNLWRLKDGEDNEIYARQETRIFLDKITKRRESGNLSPLTDAEKRKFHAEAVSEARQLAAIRLLGGLTLPVSVTYRSPYQMYLDSYRNGREAQAQNEFAFGVHEDGVTAVSVDEWFYDTYGEEMFSLTQSLSKTVDGVPPTLEAMQFRGANKDAFEESPELGAWLMGEEGAGDFVNSVYKQQFKNKVNPLSGETQRRNNTFEEVAAGPDLKLGWKEYGKAMDIIEAERIRRGLPNLRVKAAQDLAQTKRDVVAGLAEQYPEWHEAYTDPDLNKKTKRIAAMEKWSKDPRFSGRREMQGTAEYFEIRKVITDELAQRKANGGSGQLDASSNADVAEVWASAKSGLIEGNLPFSSTYYRYLEFDALEAK